MLSLESRPSSSVLENREVAPVDPNVEMFDKTGVARLREYGFAVKGGAKSAVLDRLDKYGFGTRVTGLAFRRTDERKLVAEFYVGATPFELNSRTNWNLQDGVADKNTWIKPGATIIQTKFVEDLGPAPEGPIRGMIAEPPVPAPAPAPKPYQFDWGFSPRR